MGASKKNANKPKCRTTHTGDGRKINARKRLESVAPTDTVTYLSNVFDTIRVSADGAGPTTMTVPIALTSMKGFCESHYCTANSHTADMRCDDEVADLLRGDSENLAMSNDTHIRPPSTGTTNQSNLPN